MDYSGDDPFWIGRGGRDHEKIPSELPARHGLGKDYPCVGDEMKAKVQDGKDEISEGEEIDKDEATKDGQTKKGDQETFEQFLQKIQKQGKAQKKVEDKDSFKKTSEKWLSRREFRPERAIKRNKSGALEVHKKKEVFWSELGERPSWVDSEDEESG